MYLYWRIQQDLNCLGELLQFHDPALRNAMYNWAKRNFNRMALAESVGSIQEPVPFVDSSSCQGTNDK